jgi:Asp-tRNA(Asn)/Glu-tRNA(Gln) amidotransferase A subunit family amidase
MKVMISQPMNGLTDEEILENKRKAVAQLEAQGHEVVNTFFGSDHPGGALYCLGKSLEVMDNCDAVYFLDRWKNARGCRIELQAALDYNKKLLFES